LAELRVDRDAAISYVRRMTKRPIITIPDPVLREVCAPIEKVDAETIALADDMLETMYDAPGIGLAASQVGILKRIFVLDVAKEDAPKEPMVFINPEIIWSGDDFQSIRKGACRSRTIMKTSSVRLKLPSSLWTGKVRNRRSRPMDCWQLVSSTSSTT
jgi:hypothetical protein